MRSDGESGRREAVGAVVVTVVTLVLCCGLVAWAATAERDTDRGDHAGKAPDRSAASGTAPVAGEPAAIRVYRTWQRRRAQAWRQGSPRALRRLYVDASVARADVRLLEAWLASGVTGVELDHQLLGYEVIAEGDDRVRLRVTQRLARAVARAADGTRALPRGAARRQEVVLRRVGAEWRLARVLAISRPRAARP